MPGVLVLLAEGFEEIETATVVDVLRRGGVQVVLAGLAGAGSCLGSRGMRFEPDAPLDDVLGDHWDMVVLPGGLGGSRRLAADGRVLDLLRTRVRGRQPVAAICAAPLALDRAGVLKAGEYTCYPGFEGNLETPGRRDAPVVDTPLVVTASGPATAMAFALHLVDRLRVDDVRRETARGLLFAP